MLVQMYHNYSQTNPWIRDLGAESGGEGRLRIAMYEHSKRLVRYEHEYPPLIHVFNPEDFIRAQEIAESTDAATTSVSTAAGDRSIMTMSCTSGTQQTQAMPADSLQTGPSQVPHGTDAVISESVQEAPTSNIPLIESGSNITSPSNRLGSMSLHYLLGNYDGDQANL